ncbi:MAG: fatty acyl-AMP ligase [Bryobacteraceae bacterium]
MHHPSPGETLIEVLRLRADQDPDRRAFLFLSDGERETAVHTYASLHRQACAIAAILQSHGPGQALLLYPPGLEFITAFMGCLYAGVTAVPVALPRPNQSPGRLAAIARDSQASLALTTSAHMAQLRKYSGGLPGLDTLNWLATDAIPEDAADTWRDPNVSPGSLAFLQYTSGSTGLPKGVKITHRNLTTNSEYLRQCFELSPESVSVTWLPSFHDMGLVDGVLQPIYTGFTGIIMPPVAFLQHPYRWLQAITNYRGTHCGGPNFGYDLCARKIGAEQLATLDLSAWVTAYNGAEPVSRDTLRRFAAHFEPCGFKSTYFYPCYGMAESTLIISGGRVSEPPVYLSVDASALERHRVVPAPEAPEKEKHIVGCGRTWLDTRVVIANPDTQSPCAPDQVGEICVAGGSVTDGYWNRPELNGELFADIDGDGPYLRTGDLGFIRTGELFVTGRMKDVIIIRGENHYPQDIELTVQDSHPALRPGCGAAFSVERNGAERVVVVQEVERTHYRNLDHAAVEKRIRESVAIEHGLQVTSIAFIRPASIPKTSSGKIQRRACRERYLAGTLDLVPTQTGSAGAETDKAVTGASAGAGPDTAPAS